MVQEAVGRVDRGSRQVAALVATGSVSWSMGCFTTPCGGHCDRYLGGRAKRMAVLHRGYTRGLAHCLPHDEHRDQKKRSGSNGKRGCQKRRGDPRKEAVETEWRRTAKGTALAANMQKAYRSTKQAAARKAGGLSASVSPRSSNVLCVCLWCEKQPLHIAVAKGRVVQSCRGEVGGGEVVVMVVVNRAW